MERCVERGRTAYGRKVKVPCMKRWAVGYLVWVWCMVIDDGGCGDVNIFIWSSCSHPMAGWVGVSEVSWVQDVW